MKSGLCINFKVVTALHLTTSLFLLKYTESLPCTQAFAEEIHERVRKDLWGYCSDEILDAKDLHRIKYQVISLTNSPYCPPTCFVLLVRRLCLSIK